MFRRIAIGIIFFWLTVFVFFPNLMVWITSFLIRDEISIVKPILTLNNYERLIDPVFFQIFVNSFYYAFMTTVVCLMISYPFAYILAKLPPNYRRFMLILVIIPFWTSSLIRTYSLIIILKANGIINNLLMYLGLIQTPLQILYSNSAVFIGLIYTLLPFMILPLFASIEKLDIRVIEAAYDLGASKTEVFIFIILPLTMPGIIAGCIMVFLPSLGLFYIPDLLGGAKSMLIGNFIKNQFLTAKDWPFGSAASVILTLLMGLLLIFYFRTIKRYSGEI